MRTTPPKGRKRKQGNWFQHDFGFMRKVVNDFLNGDDSSQEIATRYGITRAKVTSWAHRYETGQEPFNEVNLPVMPTEEPGTNQSELEKQNQELIKKLDQANLKITGLEIMIDIAEEQLNIEIRKKPGTKQLEG